MGEMERARCARPETERSGLARAEAAADDQCEHGVGDVAVNAAGVLECEENSRSKHR